jgi:hypothetical protein
MAPTEGGRRWLANRVVDLGVRPLMLSAGSSWLPSSSFRGRVAVLRAAGGVVVCQATGCLDVVFSGKGPQVATELASARRAPIREKDARETGRRDYGWPGHPRSSCGPVAGISNMSETTFGAPRRPARSFCHSPPKEPSHVGDCAYFVNREPGTSPSRIGTILEARGRQFRKLGGKKTRPCVRADRKGTSGDNMLHRDIRSIVTTETFAIRFAVRC